MYLQFAIVEGGSMAAFFVGCPLWVKSGHWG
jgi:hypothetical protein